MIVEHSATRLAEKAGVDHTSRTPASEADIETALAAMKANGFVPERVADGSAALARLRAMIPEGAELGTGSSTTLGEIGFMALLLSGEHPWNDLGKAVRAETDDMRRLALRRKNVSPDWHVCSVAAITLQGHLMLADGSGNRIAAMTFGAANVIVVASTNKIVADQLAGRSRIESFALPLESQRMTAIMGKGSMIGKLGIIQRDWPGRIRVILVDEVLGY